MISRRLMSIPQDDGGGSEPGIAVTWDAYWSLDEVSGTRADSTANGNDLTDNNTVGQGAALVSSGNSADFELNNSEYLSIASNSTIQSGAIDYSFSFWFKPESITTTHVLFEKFNEYVCGMNATGGGFFQARRSGGSVELNIAIPAATFVAGTKYHVVITHEVATKTGIVYVDGVSVATDTYANTLVTSTSQLHIGTRSISTALFYDGLIDEFGYTKSLLSPSDVTAIYNGGSGRVYSDYE